MARTISVPKRTSAMRGVPSVVEQARLNTAELVRWEEYQSGSRMLAYDAVGTKIGASGSWVRKFVKGYGTGISLSVGMKIVAAYRDMCARIEADAKRRMERARAISQSGYDVDLGSNPRANDNMEEPTKER